MAACAPALRPGYQWLLKKMKAAIARKNHTKLSDEIQLQSVERKLPTDHVVNGSSTFFGHETSIDTGWSHPGPTTGSIQKTTDFGVEHRYERPFHFLIIKLTVDIRRTQSNV